MLSIKNNEKTKVIDFDFDPDSDFDKTNQSKIPVV